MLKLFVGPEKNEVGVVRLLAKYRGTQKVSSQLFQPIEVPVRDIFNVVDSIDAADAILFPHDYASVMYDSNFIETYQKLSEVHKKKIIVFSLSDRDIFVPLKNVIILRTSAYRYKLRPNEIIVAPFIEDLGLLYGVSVRHKTNTTPVIGFMGLAQWGSLRARVRAYLRQLFLLCQGVLMRRKKILAHTQGIFLRRKALKVLATSQQVRSLFTTRRSFSGLARTIGLDPEKARSEYIQTMQESDFCLAPKGDGNYSLRFFEALSLGRIPVLIDTETVLPFEDKINYDDVIVRIPLQDIKNTGKVVADVYTNMTDDEFVQRQQKARNIFEEFLKPEKFYSILFTEITKQLHPL